MDNLASTAQNDSGLGPVFASWQQWLSAAASAFPADQTPSSEFQSAYIWPLPTEFQPQAQDQIMGMLQPKRPGEKMGPAKWRMVGGFVNVDGKSSWNYQPQKKQRVS